MSVENPPAMQVEAAVVVAPVAERLVPPVSVPSTRAEINKAYPKIQSDFRKVEVSNHATCILGYICRLPPPEVKRSYTLRLFVF